ncbi:MAG: ABC transporter permease subunit, partial [Bacteroidota bacterium]
LRILLRHALPNALGPVIVALAFGVAGAILLEAFLSFLSIGLPPDQVSWGSLLAQSRRQATAWWLAIFPGLAIFFTVLCLNVVGESLRRE